MNRPSLLVTALVLLLAAVPTYAQIAEPELLRIDSLVAHGDLGEARIRLVTWMEANSPGAAGSGRGSQAHALFLKGRLATDWTGAEDAYLSVVLGYPTSPHAPPALLLLAQGLLAAASAKTPSTAALRAVSYLERLTNDYPGHPLHDEAQIWLARAHAGSGHIETGCAVLRASLSRPIDPAIGQAVRVEIDSMCRIGSVNTTRSPADADSTSAGAPGRVATTTPDSVRDTARVPETPGPGRFTVQVAAMSSRAGADRLALQLTNAGFEARVVDLEGSGLIRVRVGTFTRETDASAMADRIRERGFDAIVTDDTARERRSP